MIRTGLTIEFIIGMLFFWYLLSGVVMQVLEWIASIMQWRPKALYQGIRHMLGNDGVAEMLYQHPIIQGLYGAGEPLSRRLPSYIPAKQFSSVLINILLSADHELFLLTYHLLGIKKHLGKIKTRENRKLADEEFNRLLQMCVLSDSSDYKRNDAFRNLLTTTVEKELNDLSAKYPELRYDIQESLYNYEAMRDKIKGYIKEFRLTSIDSDEEIKPLVMGMFVLGTISPNLGGLFNSFLNGGPNTSRGGFDVMVEKLNENIERWYNDAMDRLSGWYKRRSHLVALLLGFALAIIFNIDSIEFAKTLWRDHTLQSILQFGAISEIEYQTDVGSGSIQKLIQEDYFSIPFGWNFDLTEVSQADGCNWTSYANQEIGIKIRSVCYRSASMTNRSNGWFWLMEKSVGFLLTALAGAQGSSFWFDALQKFANVRLSGKKPIDDNLTSVG